jgi:WD40 repeat protein
MADVGIRVTVEGGTLQGVIAQSVVIENLTLYGNVLAAQPPADTDDGILPPCPYPGLAYFGPQDSGLFFGREAAIAGLKYAVTRRSLTALVGASGSGKSSVVLAGLAPRLNADGGWRFSHFRIGTEQDRNPFLALARALVPLYGERTAVERLEEVTTLAAKLQSGAVDLANVLGACLVHEPGKRILLVADQFEELFTLGVEEETRRSFIATLLGGIPERADGSAPNVCLVMTMRADFYGMALRHRPLADALQGRVENLGPMTRKELRDAIVLPAGVVRFESGLVDTLLDEVERRPGSLPLLQFALREMWGQQQKRCVTRASYDAIGGVEGALAQHAQAIYDSATAKGENRIQVQLFRRLFTRLVTPGEGAEDTRRVVGRDELGPDAWALAQRLADEGNRLVVTSAPAPELEAAEVVHEALIRNWPTLVDWINRDREFQLWLRRLKPRVEDRRKAPGDDDTLLRGAALVQAEEFLARRAEELSDEEKAYIGACAAARRVREAAARAEQERRIQDAERIAEEQKKVAAAQRRTNRVMIAVATLMLVLMVLGKWAFDTYVQEKQVAALLSARRWSSQSRLDLDVQAPRNLLLALNSIAKTKENGAFSLTESRKLLGDLLNATGGIPFRYMAAPSAVAFSPDDRWLAVAAADEIELRDVQGPATRVPLGKYERVTRLAFSPNGHFLAAGSADGTVRLWDMEATDRGASAHVLAGHHGEVLDLAIGPDNRLATGGHDGTARVWDLTAADIAASGIVLPLGDVRRAVTSVAFSDDGRFLATASSTYDYKRVGERDKTTIRLWNAQALGPSTQPNAVDFDIDVRKLALSHGGQWLAAGATENYHVALMRVAALDRPFWLPVDQWVTRLAFSPDDKWLATPSHYDVPMWDLTTPDPSTAPLYLRGHKSTVEDLAFSRDGKWFATASDDSTVRLWDTAQPLQRSPSVLLGHEGGVVAVAFSPDGRRLATASGDRTVRLWDTSSPAAEPTALRVYDESTKLRLWNLSDPGAPPRALGDDLKAGAGSVFSPDGKWLGAITHANRVNFIVLWKLSDPSPTPHVLPYPGSVLATPVFGGRWLATVGWGDPTISLWDLTASDPTSNPRILRGHGRHVRSLAISPDGKRLVSAGDDGFVTVWDLMADDPEATQQHLDAGGLTVRAVAISDDGRHVIAGSWAADNTTSGNTARIWDLTRPDGAATPIKVEFAGRVFEVALSHDGRWAAAASWDQTAQLIDLNKPTARPFVLRGHAARVLSVVFSRDNEWVATGSEDTTARLWSLKAPDPSAEPIVLPAPYGVGNVAFSPDSRLLALNPTEQRASPFSPDGRFATSGTDTRIYHVRLEDLIGMACRTAGRDLTADEQKDRELDAKVCQSSAMR